MIYRAPQIHMLAGDPDDYFGIVNLCHHGTLQGSVAGSSGSGNAKRACCLARKSGDREEEGGLRSLT
jgi:hypothetical protein